MKLINVKGACSCFVGVESPVLPVEVEGLGSRVINAKFNANALAFDGDTAVAIETDDPSLRVGLVKIHFASAHDRTSGPFFLTKQQSFGLARAEAFAKQTEFVLIDRRPDVDLKSLISTIECDKDRFDIELVRSETNTLHEGLSSLVIRFVWKKVVPGLQTHYFRVITSRPDVGNVTLSVTGQIL